MGSSGMYFLKAVHVELALIHHFPHELVYSIGGRIVAFLLFEGGKTYGQCSFNSFNQNKSHSRDVAYGDFKLPLESSNLPGAMPIFPD